MSFIQSLGFVFVVGLFFWLLADLRATLKALLSEVRGLRKQIETHESR